MTTAKTDRIMLIRHKKAAANHYFCEVCGKPTPLYAGQLAHRIPQRKWCVSKYSADVIHHPLNMAWVCGLVCNNLVSIAGWPVKCDKLVRRIKDDEEDKRETD